MRTRAGIPNHAQILAKKTALCVAVRYAVVSLVVIRADFVGEKALRIQCFVVFQESGLPGS